MTDKEKKIFHQFLYARGALTLFRGALKSYGFYTKDFKEHEANVSAIFAIRYSFPWDKVIDKYYWERINDKWENVCIKEGLSDLHIYSDDPNRVKTAIRELFGEEQWTKNNKNIKDMNDFIYHDFTTSNRGGKKMGKDEFSLNITDKNHSVTFNQEISNLVKGKGIKKMRIMENAITGELYFVFNHTDGVSVNFTGQSSGRPSRMPNATFNNKKLASFLVEKLGLGDGRHVLKLSGNLAKTEDFLTFKILGSAG